MSNEYVVETLTRQDRTDWLFRANGRAANRTDEECARLGRKVASAVPLEPGEYEVIVRRKLR